MWIPLLALVIPMLQQLQASFFRTPSLQIRLITSSELWVTISIKPLTFYCIFFWPPLVLFLSPPLHMFILILKYCMQWLNEHPQYIPNRVILATDSYSGIIAPVVVEKILEGKYWTKFCLSSIGINVYFCHKFVARINYMYLFICTWHYR